ncbi:hypothetical protein V6C21_07035 [[Clostridium] cellulosi]
MYDVHDKSGETNSQGRMQQAVEEWSNSAQREKVSRLSQKIKENTNKKINSEDTKPASREIYSSSERERMMAGRTSNTAANELHKDNPKDVNAKKRFSIELNEETEDEEITFPIKKQQDPNIQSDELDEIQADQDDFLKSLKVRFSFSIVLTLFLIAATVFAAYAPSFFTMDIVAYGYIILNLILLLAVGLLSFSASVKGIASLFTFKPDADSIISLSFYAALIGNIYSLCDFVMSSQLPTVASVSAVYSSCAAAGISFNLLAKIFYVSRVRNNLKLLKTIDTAYAAYPVSDDVAERVIPTFDGTPSIISLAKTDSLTDFLEKSYEPSPSDIAAKAFAPISLAVALITTIVFALTKDVSSAVIAFCSICSISSPLMFEFGVSVPFYKACKRLAKHNCLLTGCKDVATFGGADAIVADGSFIFPGKGTKIIGVKTFHKEKIEEAVLYATSIAEAGKSPLASAFLDIFADVGIGRKLLKKVDRIVFEDNKGLYAVIDDNDVLLGNRQLMHKHMVDTPSRDYEMRYTINGRDVTYLAINGQVRAIFIVMYGIDDETGYQLCKLGSNGVRVLIETSDPNITPELLEQKCGLNSDDVTVLESREMRLLEDNRVYGPVEAGIAVKDMAGYSESINACVKLKGTFWANTLLQIALAVLGMLFAVILEYFGNTVTAAFVLTYQFICAVPVLLISLLRRS